MQPDPDFPRILLVGAQYSENTGDGVISDCLSWELGRTLGAVRISHLDLAGRKGAGTTSVRHRALILSILRYLPKPIARRVTRFGLTRLMRRLENDWRAAIAGTDLVLLAGGQLFSDAGLNFPVKIGALARLCREAGKPIASVAVGASRNWSPEGAALFRQLADCDLRCVGLRDTASIEAWRAQFSAPPEPALVRDPGLFAGGCYGLEAPKDPNAPIGLGIASPMILAHHADQPVAGGGHRSTGALVRFFATLCAELVARGHRVRLFSNGAGEDVDTLHRVATTPEVAPLVLDGRVEIAPRPATGRDLATEVAHCRAIVAHRLHACILGYSLALPVVGLSWDSKLGAFFRSVGLAANMIEDADISASDAAGRVERALGAGIAREAHAANLSECSAGIARVIASCRARVTA